MSDEPPDEGSDDREVYFDFEVSPEARTGVYANTVNVWHSPYEFALDWALTEPPEVVDDDDPASPLRIPGSVVARVRSPVGLVFDVMRALNEGMTGYEAISARSSDPLKKTNPTSSATRRDIPAGVAGHVRYRRARTAHGTSYKVFLRKK